MINIVYSGNNRIFKGILLSCMSMVKKCSAPLNIFLLTMDVTEKKKYYKAISNEQADLLEKYLKAYNCDSKVTLVDIKQYYLQYLAVGPNKNTEYTPYCCNRLYIDLIKDIPREKVLYLDADTMLLDNIEKLYNMDINDYEFGVCLDYMGKFWISKDYFNSGVMLINLPKCIHTNLLQKCRDVVSKKWLKMPDQSALYRSKSKVLYFGFEFNEQREIKDNTVIKHFCKGIKYFPFFHIYNIKQWEIEKIHKKLNIYIFDDIYLEYTKLLEDYPFINPPPEKY